MPNEPNGNVLGAVAAAKYLGCAKSTLLGWAKRGCRFPGGAVVPLAFQAAGPRFRFTADALDRFRAECAAALRGEPIELPPPGPDLARGIAARDRVAAKLAGPVNGPARKPRAKAAR